MSHRLWYQFVSPMDALAIAPFGNGLGSEQAGRMLEAGAIRARSTFESPWGRTIIELGGLGLIGFLVTWGVVFAPLKSAYRKNRQTAQRTVLAVTAAALLVKALIGFQFGHTAALLFLGHQRDCLALLENRIQPLQRPAPPVRNRRDRWGGKAADGALMLAIITSHPIQYQVPIWRALRSSGSAHFEVWYLTDHGFESLPADAEFGTNFRHLGYGLAERLFPSISTGQLQLESPKFPRRAASRRPCGTLKKGQSERPLDRGMEIQRLLGSAGRGQAKRGCRVDAGRKQRPEARRAVEKLNQTNDSRAILHARRPVPLHW